MLVAVVNVVDDVHFGSGTIGHSRNVYVTPESVAVLLQTSMQIVSSIVNFLKLHLRPQFGLLLRHQFLYALYPSPYRNLDIPIRELLNPDVLLLD